jgi:hypothetical protein
MGLLTLCQGWRKVFRVGKEEHVLTASLLRTQALEPGTWSLRPGPANPFPIGPPPPTPASISPSVKMGPHGPTS